MTLCKLNCIILDILKYVVSHTLGFPIDGVDECRYAYFDHLRMDRYNFQ